MPLVHYRELVDIGVKLGKSKVKVWSLLAKQKNEDGDVVVEGMGLHLVKKLAEVFVGPRRFSKLDHAVFNANAVLVIESTHMTETIKIN